MSAPSLPSGISGPPRASLVTTGWDAAWIVLRDGRAQLCRTSGSHLAKNLNALVGRASLPVFEQGTLAALKTRMQEAAFGPDAEHVNTSDLDRETLRAAIWWAFVRDGNDPSGTPSNRVWLPGIITVPSLGQTLPQGQTTVRCEMLAPSRPTPSGTRTGTSTTTTGGGTGTTTTTSGNGGASTGSGTGTTTGHTGTATGSDAPPVTEAGMGGGGLLALLGVTGVVIAGGMALAKRRKGAGIKVRDVGRAGRGGRPTGIRGVFARRGR